MLHSEASKIAARHKIDATLCGRPPTPSENMHERCACERMWNLRENSSQFKRKSGIVLSHLHEQRCLHRTLHFGWRT